MRILLTGASGFIGRHIQHALLANKHQVIACTHQTCADQNRSHQTNENLEFITIDFMDLETLRIAIAKLQRVEVLINCVGIITENKRQSFKRLHDQAPTYLFKACKQAGVKRVIQISALGADETAITPYHLSKKAADDALRQTSLDWFILRPSLVYGSGGKSMALFQQLSKLPLIPLIGKGEQMIQPIHIHDLVATVMRCLDEDVEGQQTINVVGDQPISFRHWLIQLRRHSGQNSGKPYFLPIPFALMLRLSWFGKLIQHSFFTPDNLRMLQQNNVADSSPLRLFLGRKPLGIHEALQTTHRNQT